MRKALLILIIGSILTINNLFGDCIACWHLKRVEITQQDGTTSLGYVLWNDLWAAMIDTSFRNNFPESLIFVCKKYNTNIILYREIVVFEDQTFKNPLALDNIDTIKVDNISHIIARPDNFENLSGASGIHVITREIANKLKEKPYALYVFENELSDIYILSYNKQFDKDKLIEISKTEYWDKDKIKEYEKQGLIFLTFGYD